MATTPCAQTTPPTTPSPVPLLVTTGSGPEFETLNAEQLANAQTILDVGAQPGVGDFGLVVAIATAMKESKLVNLEYGDRDSLGLFQQSPSAGWGAPAQLRDPVLAARVLRRGQLTALTRPHRAG